jgi:early secretory antigenic target protein ESAT-6
VSEQTWNFAAIEAGSSAIQGAVGTTAGFLAEGNASLKNLAAAWGGSGSEAYQAVQARWDATSAELNTSLRELSNRIDEAAAAMLATEKGVGNLFGG